MPTVSRGLPDRPHLDVPKREARELLREWRAAQPAALERIQHRHPHFAKREISDVAAGPFKLCDAQLVIAREYGFSNWAALKQRISSNALVVTLLNAISENDRETVVQVLRANPKLLHIPLWSGNWGPPMSHAANLGRLEIIKAVADRGAKDYQHAFDRALLQGRLECARWLYEHGAKLLPGIVMGSCETLKASGLQFLADLKAPFTDAKGNRLAPLALTLGTYCRNPVGKHAVLEILEREGYSLPDTPVMAFHRGDLSRLKEHLRRDSSLLNRRFPMSQIYPMELGCSAEGGMHGTPIGGTTLLHLAIDFDEQEIFDFLLEAGADVNARAEVDSEGFGGHTPLFNAVVSCARTNGRQSDAYMVKQLLERGADPALRANVRKFLDWNETPGWHIARNVTPIEWANDFPERSWVNTEGLRLIDART